MKSLNIENFGEIMDEFIHRSDIGLLVSKEAGEDDWTVRDPELGAVMDFYIYINALPPIFKALCKETGIEDKAGFAAGILDIVRNSMLEAAEQLQKEGNE